MATPLLADQDLMPLLIQRERTLSDLVPTAYLAYTNQGKKRSSHIRYPIIWRNKNVRGT